MAAYGEVSMATVNDSRVFHVEDDPQSVDATAVSRDAAVTEVEPEEVDVVGPQSLGMAGAFRVRANRSRKLTPQPIRHGTARDAQLSRDVPRSRAGGGKRKRSANRARGMHLPLRCGWRDSNPQGLAPTRT